MSEVTLTDAQYIQAVSILWKYGQFRGNKLVCDEDDIHEYLVEDGLLKQDPDASTDPDAYQWLSDESLQRLLDTRIEDHIPFVHWIP